MVRQKEQEPKTETVPKPEPEHPKPEEEKKFKIGDLLVPTFPAEDLFQSVTAREIEVTPEMGQFLLAKIKSKESLQVIGIASKERNGKTLTLLRFDGDLVHIWAADDFKKVAEAPKEETRTYRLNQLSKKESVSVARSEVVEELVRTIRKAVRFVEEEFGGLSNLEIAQAYSELILMKTVKDHLVGDFEKLLKDMVGEKALSGMNVKSDEMEIRGRILDGCGGKLVQPGKPSHTVVVGGGKKKEKDSSDKTDSYIG